MVERLDIVVMGATGFTGMHCIPYLHKLAKSDEYNFSWGIAGRSEDKLRQVLENMGRKIGADLSEIPVIICNTENDDSLFQMAQRAKLIINCVGPFILYGEKVVDACLKAGTHHIDVSGEPNFMEGMQLEKNETAKEKGVYIISACGFDSIPCDLGIIYLEQNFGGILNTVVTYVEFYAEGKTLGPSFNYGTWASGVHSVAGESELKKIRRHLFPEKLPTFTPKIKRRVFPYKSSALNGWVLLFLGSDRSVAERTQRYLYEVENKRPVQIDTRWIIKSGFQVILFLMLGAVFTIFTKFKCGRNLLLKYPEKFSFGLFSKDQPSEEVIENSGFELILHGEGWNEGVNKDGQFSKPCDKTMTAKVKGKNPAYGSTCITLVCAALTILFEREKLAGNGNGGVYPPGAAFAKTSIIKKLNDNGVTFEIISDSI